MNQLIAIKSNTSYRQATGDNFKLLTEMELVLVHVAGDMHEQVNSQVITRKNIVETKITVTKLELSGLINNLTKFRDDLEKASHNADVLSQMGDKLKSDMKEQKSMASNKGEISVPPNTTE